MIVTKNVFRGLHVLVILSYLNPDNFGVISSIIAKVKIFFHYAPKIDTVAVRYRTERYRIVRFGTSGLPESGYQHLTADVFLR